MCTRIQQTIAVQFWRLCRMVLSLGEYWIPVVLPQTSNDILKSFNLMDRSGTCITCILDSLLKNCSEFSQLYWKTPLHQYQVRWLSRPLRCHIQSSFLHFSLPHYKLTHPAFALERLLLHLQNLCRTVKWCVVATKCNGGGNLFISLTLNITQESFLGFSTPSSAINPPPPLSYTKSKPTQTVTY